MLPAKAHTNWNLTDVFRSAEQSILGEVNALQLPKVASAIVVMVDGLGFHNLSSTSGFLASRLRADDFAHCGFPSTTVASLTSFASGQDVSSHGLFGYTIFNRSSDQSVNLLSGLDRFGILDYLKVDPISSSSNVNVHAVTLKEYEGSGFTRATMNGALHHFGDDMQTRFDIATDIAVNQPNSLIYLYVPELDKEAHKGGTTSANWSELLETLNRCVQMLAAKAPAEVGVIITADHGIVNIAAENHIFLDDCVSVSDSFRAVCGDPRAAYLYLSSATEVGHAKSELKQFFGSRAAVLEPAELIDLGYWSSSILEDDDLAPDLVAIAIEDVAIFHRDFAKSSSLKMVGHHGSFSDAEIKVPLIRLGAYSSSLLVP